jgi:small subunit ribosomal protein S4
MYGILEKQFKNYVKAAMASKGNSGEMLISFLERRLDNVIFRLGFASTRPAARQLVSHKHIYVNGKKLNIPSYQVKVNDVVTLDKTAVEIPVIKKLIEIKDVKIPGWLSRKAAAGKVKKLPEREDVTEPISELDIVEFYSR